MKKMVRMVKIKGRWGGFSAGYGGGDTRRERKSSIWA